MKEKIKIAHSPDTDDIFMFFALKEGKVTHPNFEFEITAEDIGILNQDANLEKYDITALSFHAYAHLTMQYALTSSGASMAEKDYGPMVVSKTSQTLSELSGKTIAVPGTTTTAFLLLKMALPEFEAKPMPANQIVNAVVTGEVAAGLVIHEAQIHYQQSDLQIIHNVIHTWKSFAGDLPLPLGCSAVKKSLGQEKMQALADLQKQSIEYAFAHRDAALDYARKAAPELSREEADRYLSWYANSRTLALQDEEQQAIRLLFDTAFEKGLLPKKIALEIY